ncbi:peroxiredoxin [uncultured Jannaschia sp.]|uniref:peroxiredoxin family protein n=1 Tax=uncultured Jannaschia sp. TaxID=293347 RepID=UPI00261051E4|nr:redoxin domain-containing protein [uncultured Jannaschia sp.]
MPKPGTPAPALTAHRLDGPDMDLSAIPGEAFVVFFRGLHCPACRKQLEELVAHLPAFAERGLTVLAMSMDPEDRARTVAADWAVGGIDIGYGMTEGTARNWGLYVSDRVVEKEPPRFSEPALTWVLADGTVGAHWQQSVPFGRPAFADILSGIDFVRANDRPPRGAA